MGSSPVAGHKPSGPSALRRELRKVLRDLRQSRSMTLRDVSARTRASLDYPFKIEHGRKEASSELLAAICCALDVPVNFVLRKAADYIVLQEGVSVGGISQALPVGPLHSLTPAV